MTGPSPLDRARQSARLLRREGVTGVTRRLRERAANKIAPPGEQPLPVSLDDLQAAAEIAAAGWILPPPLAIEPSGRMRLAWVCVPPVPGAGGHTTMLRILAELERAGHECTLYLDDRHGWSLRQHRHRLRRWWPSLRATVRDVREGIDDSHAIFATSWQTAYPVLVSPARGVRLYFVQDFEPSFYPAGSEALLAEATLGFGFHGVTAGRWLARRLQRDYGMSAGHFDFGCDDASYVLDGSVAPAARTGVCFYARPSTARRAFSLGVAALELFASLRPDVEIHLFGEPLGRVGFPVTSHGKVGPAELAELYNHCAAGLVLSATNVSLVPHEMLGAGCVPVVNDAEHNRVVLDNPHVVYAPATPVELANALGRVVERPPGQRQATAEAAAASVKQASWQEAGAAVERIVAGAVRSASDTADSRAA